jgi:hypothetical protein
MFKNILEREIGAYFKNLQLKEHRTRGLIAVAIGYLAESIIEGSLNIKGGLNGIAVSIENIRRCGIFGIKH